MKYLYLCLALLIMAGCAQKSAYIEPINRADRMLYYYEKDRRGEKHPISSETVDLDSVETKRIPNPALVDIDSSIQIKVRRPPGDPATEFAGEEANLHLEKKEKVLRLLESLDDLMGTRQQALKTYAANQRDKELDKLIKELSSKKISFIREFTSLYPKGSKPYRAANRLVGTGGGLGALKPFLEVQLEVIKTGDKEIQKKAKTRSSKLRIEAFLDKVGKEELLAIHVKGYDSLPERKVVARDRWGLNLSEMERENLSKQIKATEDLARTLESVRTKEQSIQDGLRESLSIVVPDLARQVEQAEALAGKLADTDRIDKVRADLENAINKAREDMDAFTDVQLDKVEHIPELLTAALTDQMVGVESILEIITEADSLARKWQQAGTLQDLDSVASIAMETRILGERIEDEIKKLPQWLQESVDTTEILMNQQIEGIQQDAMNTLEELVNSEELQAVVEDIQGYYADIRTGVKVIQKVTHILKIGMIPVEEVAPTVPEAFDVDIEDLQDTLVDLKLVPAQDGDSILLRATLKEPGRENVESEARFEVTYYGWHARLSPSVVLVRPDELAGGNTGFRFAPALGWMHHYRPRPSATGFPAALQPLQPAIGIHSIFLNFNDKSGIGLGGTLAFWNDRLQFGAGYNLSAGSSEEGRIYYFIGSDLIGLLQTVGIGGQ